MTDEMETSIHAIAVDICRTEPNIEAATKKLRKKLLPRKEEIMEELYESAVRRAVHVARGSLMTQVKQSATPSGSRVVAGAADGSASFDRGFLASWQTPDGRWLADVNGNDLQAFAAMESSMAAGHARVAWFYESLASRVGDRRGGDAITDKQAIALWNNKKGQQASEDNRTALLA